jgi:manganese oxidase
MQRNDHQPCKAKAGDSPWRPLLALAVTAGIIIWEAFLYGYVFRGDSSTSLLIRGLARDAMFLFPVVLGALAGGLWLSRRLGTLEEGARGALSTASLSAVLFFALALPVAVGRTSLAPITVDPSALGIESASERGISQSRFLCAPSSSRRLASAEAPSFLSLVSEGAVITLILQLAFFPLALMAVRRRMRTLGLLPLNPNFPRKRLLAVALVLTCAVPDWPEEGLDEMNVAYFPMVDSCTTGGITRAYTISAINVSITLNRFGDRDPNGFMYVLDSKINQLRQEEFAALPDRVSVGLREDLIQPLVLRANAGECLQINFTNRLSTGRSSWHVNGLPYTVVNAGGLVGLNPDTFVNPGQAITYRIPIPTDPTVERAYYFHEHGASRQRVAHGLFGSLIVEPAGSVFRNPETGLVSDGTNWESIIQTPAGSPDFREYVLIYHEIGDETFTGILDANGASLPQVDNLVGVYRPGGRAINYRSEPFFRRMEIFQDKSQAYGSYMFGDPATPVPRSYLGEPTKTRLLHGGSEVFHVHHLHGGGDRWRRNPKIEASDFAVGLKKLPVQNALSTRLDSQSIGPGVGYNLEHECGAGGCQQSAGDFLFHCHIGHHYNAGMWGFWRVFDTLQSDLATLPDRTPRPLAVNSLGLIGKTFEGKTIVPAAQLTNTATQRSLEEWVESQLPPPGARFHEQDATVWDWQKNNLSSGPLYLGEPEDASVWANFASPTPGQRPEIMFNPNNGRYAWPLLRPHLGKRPPFSGNGHSGSPWLGEFGSAQRPDGLCPNNEVLNNPGRQIREYPITAIEVALPLSDTKTDPEGHIFVLNEDKQAVLAGLKPAQPLALRSNVGDCVKIIFTNEIFGELTDSQPKVNMHTHFVQFDPQGSDGVISGMSYEQAVRSYKEFDNRTLTAAASAGATTITTSQVTDLRPGIWIGIGLGEGMCTPPGGGVPHPCTEVRKITAINGTTITLNQPLTFSHAVNQAVGVEFVRYDWYSDVDNGAIFWHDHVSFLSWGKGMIGAHIIEPAGSTYHDPTTGAEIRSGPIADIRTPANATIGAGQLGSFREFMAWTTNDNKLVDALINFRSEPLHGRTGMSNDMSKVFSSVTYGDPLTPIPRAYVGDPFVFRHISVDEFMSGLRVTGHRFAIERFANNGALSDTAPTGVSERFDLVLKEGAGGPQQKAGDYLYYSTLGNNLVEGAWGIFRVHDKLRTDLKPLPGRTPPPSGTGGFPQQTFTGGNPAASTTPGQPCPATAPVKRFEVRLVNSRIDYNNNDKDSGGIVYIVNTGTTPTSVTAPMVMRVNRGDCLEINLNNRSGQRGSANVGELSFDPQNSYGAAIGFNTDSTVANNGTKLYRYYADLELGTNILFNLAQPETGARGAFGAVIVEPLGSTYRNPVTGAAQPTGVIADIISPQGKFREMVALFSDEDPRIGANTMPYPRDVSNFSGLSYSTSPFKYRNYLTDPSKVFSTALFGDPRLVLKAHKGDPVTLRVAMPWGEQAHSFRIEGHRWPMEPNISGAEQIADFNIVPGYAFDARLTEGAGSGMSAIGDFLFGDGRVPFIEAGLWGILRVFNTGQGGILPL